MTPTPHTRLLSRTALALGWLALVIVARETLAVDNLPPCTSYTDKTLFCKNRAVSFCADWNGQNQATCLASGIEVAPQKVGYCLDTPQAFWGKEGWIKACVDDTLPGGAPAWEICSKQWRCRWDAMSVNLPCKVGDAVVPPDRKIAVKDTGNCAVPPEEQPVE